MSIPCPPSTLAAAKAAVIFLFLCLALPSSSSFTFALEGSGLPRQHVSVPSTLLPKVDTTLDESSSEDAMCLLQHASKPSVRSTRTRRTVHEKVLGHVESEAPSATLLDRSLVLAESIFGQEAGSTLRYVTRNQATLATLLPALLLLPVLALALVLVARLSRLAGDVRLLLAELVGTLVLVFTIVCCSFAGDRSWNPTAIGCTLMVLVYAMGPISGGHFNPAVTLSVALSGHLAWSSVTKYWAAQFFGGACGMMLATALSSLPSAALAPVAPFLGCHALLGEFLFTCMLSFVVLNCAVSTKNNSPNDGNQFFGLAIGFVIIGAGHAVGDVSGALLNPAVSIALDIKRLGLGWGVWYALFQCLGAAVATLLYNLVRPQEGRFTPHLHQQQPSQGYSSSSFRFATGSERVVLEDHYGLSNMSEAEPELSRALEVSEFVGTFFLVLTVCLNLVTGSLSVAWSASAALLSMIFSLGDVSGAHFNPAVSFAVYVSTSLRSSPRPFPRDRLWRYFLAQCAAATGAAVASGLVLAQSNLAEEQFGVQPGAGHSLATAGFVEVIFTTLLIFVVLATATTAVPATQVTQHRAHVALSIAFTVAAGGSISGPISGGSLNPAVALGLTGLGRLGSASVGPSLLTLLLICSLQMLSGLLAVGLFQVTYGSRERTEEDIPVPLRTQLLAEFFGTYVLAFGVGSTACLPGPPSVWTPTALGCLLAALVYSLAPISGANLNPAVSLCLGLVGEKKPAEVWKFAAVQILAGLAAGISCCLLFAPAAPSLGPVQPFSFVSAGLLEVLFTFLLCFAVLNCAVSKRTNPEMDGNQSYGLAIGFVLTAGAHAAGGISGAVLNPAVAIGLDIKHVGVHYGLTWCLFQCLGSVFAASVFWPLRPDQRMPVEEFRAYKPTLRTKCAAECLTAFIFVTTVGLCQLNSNFSTSVVSAHAISNNNNNATDAVAAATIAVTDGAALLSTAAREVPGAASAAIAAWPSAACMMVLVYCLQHVSGCYSNPAVTLALITSGRNYLSKREGGFYIVAQLAGGLLAGLFCAGFRAATGTNAKLVAPLPGDEFGPVAAGFAEMIFTALLAYVVLAVCTTTRPANWTTKQRFHIGLAVGACYVVGGIAALRLSGGLLGPAVTLGVALEAFNWGLAHIFVLWQLAGALLAGCLFRLTHSEEFKVEDDEDGDTVASRSSVF